jgi:energy-coupling factor transporter transmembrane protein EcfT
MTGSDASDDPDRRWPAGAALLLALVGSAVAAPPDPVTMLAALVVIGVGAVPAGVYVAARSPASASRRPFLAFVALAVLAGGVFAELAGFLPGVLGGFLPVLAFLAGVYVASAVVQRRLLAG